MVGGEKDISLSHIRVYVNSDSVSCLGKMNENPQSNYAWEDRLMWFKSSLQYRTLDTIDGEPMGFEWNIFPGFTTLQLCNKVQEFLSNMSAEPEVFTGRIIFMSMFNDISWGSKENERECELSAQLVSMHAKRFSPGKGSSSYLECEDRFSTEPKNPLYPVRKKGQSGGTKKPQKDDRFLRGRQIAYLIFEYFRVTGANDSVEYYADLFTTALRNDDIQEFDSKWDGILLSMTKIPSDDILEGLYELRKRESEKLKTVLESFNMEIHQKKAGPDYHRLKTMVKRSIEQNLRIKNFEARHGNYERNATVKNQGTKQREQRTLGDCWQWKANGQCSKGESVTISISVQNRHSRILLRALLRGRMREMRRDPEVQEARVPVEECFDSPARITSKELARISVKNGILQDACSTSRRMDADLVRSALMRIARLKKSLVKRSKNGDKVQWLC